jgi:hypothetical protein
MILQDLCLLIWIGAGLINVLLIGHEYAGQDKYKRDGADAFFKCVGGIVGAPWFLVFLIGYRIKNFPKIKISVTKEN